MAMQFLKVLFLLLLGLTPIKSSYALQAKDEHFVENGHQVRLWGIHLSPGMSAPEYASSKHIVEQLTRSAIGALRTTGDPDLQLVWARTAAALEMSVLLGPEPSSIPCRACHGVPMLRSRMATKRFRHLLRRCLWRISWAMQSR